MNMKKRIAVFLLAGLMGISMLIGGCSSKSEEKAQEYKELGIKQMKEESYEDAVASFQKALDQSLGTVGAQEVDVCLYKALAQFKSGDVDGAIETYSGLIDYNKKNWEAYYLRGCVYLKSGQGELCLKDFEQAVTLNGNDFKLYSHIYENLAAAGYEEQGQKYLAEAVNLKVSSAEDYAGIGYVYFLKQDYENAEKNLKQAVEKGYDKALLELGQVYAANGKTEEAKASFESYMEKYPKDSTALNELGEIALSAEDYEDAVKYFSQAAEVAEKSDLQEIWRNLVVAYERTGDFDNALDIAEDYVGEFPNDESMQKEYEFLQTRASDETGDTGENVISGEVE